MAKTILPQFIYLYIFYAHRNSLIAPWPLMYIGSLVMSQFSNSYLKVPLTQNNPHLIGLDLIYFYS